MSAPGPGAAWYLRTWRDLLDVHLVVECPGSSMVRARCGVEFEPAARFTCGGLPAVQAPDERVCADCQAQQEATGRAS